MVISYLLINLKWDREQSPMQELRRIDYGGNMILVASTVSNLVALTWGGPVHTCSAAQVIVQNVVGVLRP